MNILRQPVIIGIIIVALIVTIIGAVMQNNKKKAADQAAATTTTEQPVIVSNLTNLDPADFDNTTKNEYALASAKALEVRTDYQIGAIIVEIGQNLQADSVNTRYVFISPKDTINNWTITISQASNNYIRALIPKADYMGDLPSMNTKLWQYNYVTALKLAEKAGGQDWRGKNDLQSVKLTLAHGGSDNALLWKVEYTGASNNFIVNLDASTGAVVQ